ncbi:MAG: Mut7-C RNAse domain-containing protein [Actinomycetota bacterium]
MRATFRFYAELNDFLPPERRFRTFDHEFLLTASVKDLIESLGVPHTEVDLILVRGDPVDFSYRVTDGDNVSVYPVFESFDISSEARLRPEPLRETRFVLDAHLGQLARYLRLLGFDTVYRNDWSDVVLADISYGEKRVLLSRDAGVLKRRSVTHGYFVRETEPREQLLEVLRRFDLFGSIEPFRRCLTCNGVLEPVDKEAIAHELEPDTRRYYDRFRRCASCGQLFWEGSHYRRMERFVAEIRRAAG